MIVITPAKTLARATLMILSMSSPLLVAKGLPENLGASTRVQSSPNNFIALRDRGLIRQAQDFSCGAAALATLLTYQWQEPVTEQAVLRSLVKISPPNIMDARQSNGLTLLDLQRLAQSFGYRAAGLRATPEQLSRLQVPVIVYIEPLDYPHFSVLRGIREGRAYLADPSQGNVSYPLHRFLSMWLGESGKGVLLAVEPPQATSALITAGQLAPATITQPGLNDFRSLMPISGLSIPHEMITPR